MPGLNHPGLNLLRTKLVAAGFTQWPGDVFTRSLADGVSAWLGLRWTWFDEYPGVVQVDTIVGVRHDGVQIIAAKALDQVFQACVPATVVDRLDDLMDSGPEDTVWTLLGEPADEGHTAELLAKIQQYGEPYFDRFADLDAVIAELRRRWAMNLASEEGRGHRLSIDQHCDATTWLSALASGERWDELSRAIEQIRAAANEPVLAIADVFEAMIPTTWPLARGLPPDQTHPDPQ